MNSVANSSEIDARPSDCLALATAQKTPYFSLCHRALFEKVEDMSEVLERINESSGESEDPE